MNKSISILILEDDPLIAEDIQSYLKSHGFNQLQVCYNPTQAFLTLEENNTDLVLLDINLESDISGIEVAQRINKEFHIPFIYITSYADSKTIQEVKATYPVGYILKPFNEKEIPAIIEIGMELFYTYISPAEELDKTKLNLFCSEELTTKEFEVVQKIAEGKTNQEIADSLFVSLNTVKTHLKNIFVKMDIKSRSEAIVLLNKAKITR